jgi:hypothetical protein
MAAAFAAGTRPPVAAKLHFNTGIPGAGVETKAWPGIEAKSGLIEDV